MPEIRRDHNSCLLRYLGIREGSNRGIKKKSRRHSIINCIFKQGAGEKTYHAFSGEVKT